MRSIFSFLLFFFSSYFGLISQETGVVKFYGWGLEFEVPESWEGIELMGKYFMSSPDEFGFMFLIPVEAKDMGEIRQVMQMGITDYFFDTQLKRTTKIRQLNERALIASFEGLFAQLEVKVIYIGLCNPLGTGAKLWLMVPKELFLDSYEDFLIKVESSITFFEPREPRMDEIWQYRLQQSSLTRTVSFESGSLWGRGYEEEQRINLCADGSFSYQVTSGSGMAKPDMGGIGYWKVVLGPSEESVLRLTFGASKKVDFVLTWEGKQTYLNGELFLYTDWEANPEDESICR